MSGRNIARGSAVVARAWSLFRPPPKQTVSEWADAERRLSAEAADEPGPWRTDRAPFQRGIMDALSERGVTTVVVMKSAQVGATEAILNFLGWAIHRSPGPIMVLQPTVEMAEAFSKDRLDPMIRDTPAIRRRIYTRRSKEGGSNILHKKFRGGHVTMTGANSPAQLASRPIRFLCSDEPDRYPPSAGKEGDPLDLARKRTTTFHRRKILIVSTPTIAGQSRIEKEFAASDQRYYLVPCPECGEFQRLRWANVHWNVDAEDQPSDVRYQCEECGSLIDDTAKGEMLAKGRWEATRPFFGTAGFHISEMYSPWVTWTKMAKDFLQKKKEGKQALKTWINTALGECWVEHEQKVEAHLIEQRAELYELGRPPRRCIVLTASVDVQGNRLEILTKGWAELGEGWAVDWRSFHGSPSQPDVWEQLDRYLLTPMLREDGIELRIACTTVDSGFMADEVYRFTSRRSRRRVWATKGVGGEGRPIVGRVSKGRAGRIRAALYPVGVDAAKDLFFERLSTPGHGPGFQHYPQGLDREFFDQVTSETKEVVASRGRNASRWVQLRKRNEALDLEVGNIVAFQLLNPNLRAIARAHAELVGLSNAEVQREADPREPSKRTDVSRAPTKSKSKARSRKKWTLS